MNAIAMIMINDNEVPLRSLQKTDRARSEVVWTLFRAKSGVSLGAGTHLPVRKADRRASLLNAAEADVFVSVGERVGWEVRGVPRIFGRVRVRERPPVDGRRRRPLDRSLHLPYRSGNCSFIRCWWSTGPEAGLSIPWDRDVVQKPHEGTPRRAAGDLPEDGRLTDPPANRGMPAARARKRSPDEPRRPGATDQPLPGKDLSAQAQRKR